MKESIIDGLRKIGLVEYEARAYAALVGLGEANAREIHEASKVPRTRIYDILRELTNKGFVEFIAGSPNYYKVVEPDSVMDKIRDELVEAIDRSKKELKDLNLEVSGYSPVWCIKSDWAIEKSIKDFLANAEEGKVTIYCRNLDFARRYRSELKRRKAIVIVDDQGRFEEAGLELKEMKEHFAEQFRDMTMDGVSYGLDCLMINAGRETLVISRKGKEKLAITIKLPMISMLQEWFLSLSVQ